MDIKDYTLIKYINRKTSPAEDNEVYRWINQSKKNTKYYASLRNLLVFSSIPEEYTSGTETDIAAEKIFSADDKIKRCKTKQLLYAACLTGLLIVGLLTCLLLKRPHTEVNSIVLCSGQNSVMFITLPDNTKLSLNKNSMVRYSKKYGIKDREIYAEGEVLFEVNKNPKLPFVLLTKSDIKVKVLGTTFLFNDSNDCFTTILLKGTVNVLLPKKYKKTEREILLAPNEKITISADNTIDINQIDTTETILEWRDEYLSFKNSPLKNILEILSSYYNVHLSCCPNISNMMLTINVKDKSLNEFISLVEHSLSVCHIKTENSVCFINH
ncbi:MAG: FecR family protein [Bacteroidales bacterium]|jgi:ferric-dicitrate binding protein FerR (iron transport regulator)|nr:FecR family protein [Bacteroidales bacterium]MDD2263857.1 FecR family protein [Bacteroidales bacterium]MDD2830926.1 FecR family protein [Bacteroidales bacterium]MDD3208266.1 FecR family protein [Bacteroidales bacterium]MDD3696692.1 FecR family protein [Bacteroidales bacterium]